MYRKFLPSVFFGGAELDAKLLRRSLRIGSYTLHFNPDTQIMTLDDREGGEILRVTCARESVVKFATDFGFPDDGSPTRNDWRIFVPEPKLWSDGSKNAERIRIALLESGLPYQVVTGERELAFSMGTGRYTVRGGFSIDWMLEMIRQEVGRSADTLALFNER